MVFDERGGILVSASCVDPPVVLGGPPLWGLQSLEVVLVIVMLGGRRRAPLRASRVEGEVTLRRGSARRIAAQLHVKAG